MQLTAVSSSHTSASASRPVEVADMLAARDRRAAGQRTLLARYRCAVVSLTAVMPGPVKDTPLTRATVAAGVDAVLAVVALAGWPVLERLDHGGPTGAEVLLAVAAPARALKRALIEIEEDHALGRLWDIDVLDINPVSGTVAILSRKDYGLPPRSCLVCGGPAHACARARTHPIADLVAIIESTAHAHFRCH